MMISTAFLMLLSVAQAEEPATQTTPAPVATAETQAPATTAAPVDPASQLIGKTEEEFTKDAKLLYTYSKNQPYTFAEFLWEGKHWIALLKPESKKDKKLVIADAMLRPRPPTWQSFFPPFLCASRKHAGVVFAVADHRDGGSRHPAKTAWGINTKKSKFEKINVPSTVRCSDDGAG